MHATVNMAVRAARAAGDVIVRNLDRLDRVQVDSKGRNDFVSDVDRMAEEQIIHILRRAYPDHAILGEESGSHGQADYEWVIDPLDGTTNYLHGFPHYAVSIALRHRGRLESGVIYDPLRQELFTAHRGAGCQLDGRRLRVTRAKTIDGALLGTGFPFKNPRLLDPYMAMFRDVSRRASDLRRAGSAALDLAYVAAGRLDGFWELGLQPWDMAAGALMVKEAGGLVGDVTGGERHMQTGHVVAGNPKLFADLLRTIRPHYHAETMGG
ncbi:inositol monophosphatase family protein [Alkalilimnicola ehrlichii]|uniref:inositol monophosphatase family protein n=1 Tax=Alkalilimnicola ehrlichii TaxID=351052 RepID=UPI003B9DF402